MTKTKNFATTFFASSIHNAIDKIMVELELIRKLANQHSGEKGREAEGILNGFFKTMLPKKWTVDTGFIMDENEVSSQVDIIIHNQLEAPPLYSGYSNVIIPIHTLGCAFEVKMQLNGLEEFLKYQDNAKTIKNMHTNSVKTETQPIYIVFVYSSEVDLYNLEISLNKSEQYYIDCICILNKGFIFLNSHKSKYFSYHASDLNEIDKKTVLGYTIKENHMVMIEFYAYLMYGLQNMKTEVPDYHSWKDESLEKLFKS
ncbi:hypothetical protein NGE73_07895 [Bacillus cereus]|uniref:DUF6602 domain-containing protein n=1 Tax=Bacillus anthracis TaxID=1392 RepID=A0A0J1HZ42_BACAN|nr:MULTISPECIES: DUF6602 domain-containing protein [Bacillus cereus group]EDX67052.1 hypothetical protein BC059799_1307 [Bacillus cereus NVH0597-99]KLV18971.1 hypothetical protein ABW01_10300 [Bacillus anthracis]MBJ8082401.1 hypothetical protein [Bacillus cereus group sp. N14]MDA2472074.1 hypothetical protein [Bacillus cereus]MDE7542750.1 hypothetical protein [Bacillus cereus]